jgi:hypothetical protein
VCKTLYGNIENTNIQKACPSIEYWAREDNFGNTLGTIFRTTLSRKASPLPSPPKKNQAYVASSHWLPRISILNCVHHHFWPGLIIKA